MVTFGGGYYSPMDRGYNATHEHGHGDVHGHNHSHGTSFGVGKSTGDIGVGIGDLGFSFSLGPVPNVQAIAAKIRPGAKRIELAFTGTGKGTGQSQTPEYYGKKQRQALREISQANRVDFTTHSTIGIAGLAGMDQQGNFSKASKNFSLQEVKRAIEFAGDVGGGGPVVVHTGEFQRPIVGADWNQKGKWAGKFKMFEDEAERSAYRVIDTRTGQVIQEARKNRKVARPVWKRYNKESEEWGEHSGRGYVDSNGNRVTENDYIDYFGNKVSMAERVPIFDPENDKFKIKEMDWDDFTKEAKELTDRARKFWRQNKGKNDGTWAKDIWKRFKHAESEDEIVVRPEEAFIIATLETNAAHARGWAYAYGGQFDEDVKQLKKLMEAKKFYDEIEASAKTQEEKEQLKRQGFNRYGDLIPPDIEYPSETVASLIRQQKNKMEQGREAAASQWSQAADTMEQIRHVESAETYAFKEALDAYADLGINAWRQSKVAKDKGHFKKPIAIAMENLFPEQYGAHPEELMRLVKGSRKVMKKKLQKLGMDKETANELAKKHITSTFDTGHLNVWRKYWDADPKKSVEQNDEDFNKWSLAMVDKLSKEGIIGHVHLDDNYGYHDDHLAPGEGNTPIREMIKILKKNGYKGEMIVEPGADFSTDASGFHSVLKTWRHFGIPVYGHGSAAMAGRGRSWEQVGYGWFGQQAPPYFTFGGYSPSEDWTLWSGVPLE